MLYKIVYWPVWFVFHIIYRMKVTGSDNIPKEGPVILCANHSSFADPITVVMATRRKPSFMAKKELFKFKPFGALIRALGAFPVSRGAADIDMYRTTTQILKGGGLVLIFSQGGRRKEIDVKDAKAGAALFALRTNAALVPVGIDSTYRWFSKLRVNVGKPMDLSEYKDKKVKTELLSEITEKLMTEVMALCEESREARSKS